MSEMQVQMVARQMIEKHGFVAIAEAAQKAQDCERKGDALRREAAQRYAADDSVFFDDLLRIEEAAELLGLRLGGHGGRQAHPKALPASKLYALPRTRPCASTAMAIVPLRRRAVEADL